MKKKSTASNLKNTPAVTAELEIHQPSAELESSKPKPCAFSPETETNVSYDENLLERSWTQWQFGDWQSLAEIPADSVEHHPDRAILAMLSAAGNLQMGNMAQARLLITQAQDWGCDKKMIRRILISGVHNSLGRAASLIAKTWNDFYHFKTAIATGMPGLNVQLLTKARSDEQLGQLGLINDREGLLQQYQALTSFTKKSIQTPREFLVVQKTSSEAYKFYVKLNQISDQDQTPFLLIDSKSLPRSGLHYLKNTLNKVFGEYFSFCEWYQEPGCCKKMPCELTGFATHSQETKKLRIRLIKSHDFDLTDPVFKSNRFMRRLVLVREPLYILTSWFALEQLNTHKDILARSGININKIFLSHEKEVLKPAYRLINKHFEPPSMHQLKDWLEKKTQYIAGFMEKWVKPGVEQPGSFSFTQVVRYDEINNYVESLVREFQPYISLSEAKTIEKTSAKLLKQFQKREDPYAVPAENITKYIRNNAMLFDAAVLNISEPKHSKNLLEGCIMEDEELHLFDNGIKIIKRHLLPEQLDRYAIRNVHETEEEDVFVDLIRNMPLHGVYVNIGSAVGYYVLLARKLRPDIRVIAIEPLDVHREYFIENIKVNSFRDEDFEIHDYAVSSTNGEVEFLMDSYGSQIRFNQSTAKKMCKIVPSKTLDSIAIKINAKIDVCQMDVQGAESAVLNGAAMTMRSGGITNFLIGTHGEIIHNECVRLLKDAGFQVDIDNCCTVDQPDGIIFAKLQQ